MKIKLLTSISGLHGSWMAGQTVDWPSVRDARRLVDAKFAEAAEPWPKDEEPEPTPPPPSDEQAADQPSDEAKAEAEAKPEKKKKPAK